MWRKIRSLLGGNCEFFEECEKVDQSDSICRIGGGIECHHDLWSIKKLRKNRKEPEPVGHQHTWKNETDYHRACPCGTLEKYSSKAVTCYDMPGYTMAWQYYEGTIQDWLLEIKEHKEKQRKLTENAIADNKARVEYLKSLTVVIEQTMVKK